MSSITSKTALIVGIAIGSVGMLALTEITSMSSGSAVLDSGRTWTGNFNQGSVQLPLPVVAQAQPTRRAAPDRLTIGAAAASAQPN